MVHYRNSALENWPNREPKLGFCKRYDAYVFGIDAESLAEEVAHASSHIAMFGVAV